VWVEGEGQATDIQKAWLEELQKDARGCRLHEIDSELDVEGERIK
jgi:hypothetical protein